MKERMQCTRMNLAGVILIMLGTFAGGAICNCALAVCGYRCARHELYNWQNTEHWRSSWDACWTYYTSRNEGTAGCNTVTQHSIYDTDCVAQCMAGGWYGEDFIPVTIGCSWTYVNVMNQYDVCN